MGNDQQYLVQGAVSVPIIKDMLAVRVAGGYEHFGGSYKDDVNGERAGGYKKRDVQASFQFKPDDNFTAVGSYYYGNDVFGPSAIAYNANNCGARTVPLAQDPSGTGFSQFCGRFDPDQHPVEVPKLPDQAGAAGNARKVNLASLNLSYDFGLARITSITGYTKVNQERYTDFIGRRAGTPYTLVPGPGTVNLLELFGSNTNNRDFSQEIRLQSDGSKPFRVQAGAFYYKGKFFTTTILGLDATPIPAGQTINAGFPRNSLTVNGQLSNNIIGQTLSHDRQYSGFLGAEYDIVTGLTVSGEYRYTDQKRGSVGHPQHRLPWQPYGGDGKLHRPGADAVSVPERAGAGLRQVHLQQLSRHGEICDPAGHERLWQRRQRHQGGRLQPARGGRAGRFAARPQVRSGKPT